MDVLRGLKQGCPRYFNVPRSLNEAHGVHNVSKR
jgi:hypothetical protein